MGKKSEIYGHVEIKDILTKLAKLLQFFGHLT
jgi:hypothetical protein